MWSTVRRLPAPLQTVSSAKELPPRSVAAAAGVKRCNAMWQLAMWCYATGAGKPPRPDGKDDECEEMFG